MRFINNFKQNFLLSSCIFSILSGVIGLSYEVIYQRILSSIAGDTCLVYAIVVLTFICFIALGNFFSIMLRKFLPILEIFSGAFAVIFAIYLKLGGYENNINYFHIVMLMSFPAFVIGTNIPLYSYYLRKLNFTSIYALYHLGSVFAVLFIEFFAFSHFPQSAILLFLGLMHIVIGIVLQIFVWKHKIVLEKETKVTYKWVINFAYKYKDSIIFIFLFSIASFYFNFWAIKISYYLMGPFRLISSLSIAASIFWIFIGTIITNNCTLDIDNHKKIKLYGLFFIIHITFIVIATPFLDLFFSSIIFLNPKLFFVGLTFLIFSPVVWATIIFVFITKKIIFIVKKEDIISGILLFVSSLGNLGGFIFSWFFMPKIISFVYFIPLFVIFFIILSYKRNINYKQLCILIFLFMSLIFLFKFPRYTIANRNNMLHLRISRISIPSNLLYKKMITSYYQDLLLNYNSDYNLNLGGPFKYFASSYSILGIIPETGFGMDAGRHYYMIDGYVSNPLENSREHRIGFIPRMYFNKTIPNSLVIGLGTGETAFGIASVSKKTNVIEISNLLIQKLDYLKKWNGDFNKDKDTTIINADAITILKQEHKKYNAIINTSTSSYTNWAAKLYTNDFLKLVRRSLTDDGVYEIWTDNRVLNSTTDFINLVSMLNREFKYIDVHILADGYIAIVMYNQQRNFDILFKYNMVKPEFQEKINVLKAYLPTEKIINKYILRNLILPYKTNENSTFDYPLTEIKSVNKILNKEISIEENSIFNNLLFLLNKKEISVNNKDEKTFLKSSYSYNSINFYNIFPELFRY